MQLTKLIGLAALLGTMTLVGCSGMKTTAVLPSLGSPIRAVPCVELPVLGYHAPTDAKTASAWLSEALPDPQNAYDTPQTVTAIRRQNAARMAVCGP